MANDYSQGICPPTKIKGCWPGRLSAASSGAQPLSLAGTPGSHMLPTAACAAWWFYTTSPRTAAAAVPALVLIRLEKLSAGCQARTAYVMPAFDTLQSASWEERLNVSEWAMSSELRHNTKIRNELSASRGGEDSTMCGSQCRAASMQHCWDQQPGAQAAGNLPVPRCEPYCMLAFGILCTGSVVSKQASPCSLLCRAWYRNMCHCPCVQFPPPKRPSCKRAKYVSSTGRKSDALTLRGSCSCARTPWCWAHVRAWKLQQLTTVTMRWHGGPRFQPS